MKHSGENEIPTFFPRKSDFFFSKIWFFLEYIRNSEGCPCTYSCILLFENIRNLVFGHFPSFPASSFMPRVTYLQYLTQCGVKPGLYSVRRSTQTELRKRIYAHTRRVMAFILLRRSRRISYCRSVYTRHLRDLYGVDRHWWPGKRAPSAQNGLRITVYGVDLHSKYKPGFRDQESDYTILDISFDTRYLDIAQVSSDWSLIHSIFDISKYRDTTKYRYRTFTSIAILRYIEYRTSTN